MNPLSAAPIFVGVTAGYSAKRRNRQAWKASLYMAAILLVSLFAGALILKFFGISTPILQVAGGLIITRVGFGMIEPARAQRVLPEEQEEAEDNDEVALTPVAMPMLAGPGSIATTIAMATESTGIEQYVGVSLGICVVSAISWITLCSASGLHKLVEPFMGITAPFLIMAVIAVAASIFLNRTVWGRWLFAIGRNERAAVYSGINTHAVTIMAYVVCAFLAGWGGILMALDVNSIQPAQFGNFYELYAISAAVLGGCSLRGGEGSILGVVIGSAVMRVLYNAINILHIPTHLEFAIIGAVILSGVIVDELVKRIAAKRRATRRAAD